MIPPCPYCRAPLEVVTIVAGHVQCPVCHKVIEECCTGETISMAAETDPMALDTLGKLPRRRCP